MDPLYNRPVIDSETDLAKPLSLHKVSGHFEGTTSRFNIYFPAKDKWQGRFFQMAYPLGDGNATDGVLLANSDAGAYTVQTSGALGYRLDAAAAKFSKSVAERFYGSVGHQIYGYLYGGSGGSYQVIGGIENSVGVWDGAVPFVVAAPTSLPNNFFVRAFARTVLGDKAEQIADAVRPGGSGDPYRDLNSVESSVLSEVTKMGVPLRSWDDPSYLLGLNDPSGLLGYGKNVRSSDPQYAGDFWNKPGYLGSELSELGDFFRSRRINTAATISQVNRDGQNAPTSFVLESLPSIKSTLNMDFTVRGREGAVIGTLSGTLDQTTRTFTPSGANPAASLAGLVEGNQLFLDNSWGLALTAYHRYQVPKEPGFHAWDQFRAADGTPIYPQRAVEMGPGISAAVSGGGTFTGKITGKVIVVSNLLDPDAYPWQADWYAQRVNAALGEHVDDNFRVWLNDNADHLDGTVIASGPAAQYRSTRLIDYSGMLMQAVRDVSAWVEKGAAPAKSTKYGLKDSQFTLPGNAAVRRGIQPTVDVTSNGETRIDVAVGQSVTLQGKIQVPVGAGKVTMTEWDPMGSGNYVPSAFGTPRQTIDAQTTVSYTEPGTYYPALRATSQRFGDANTPFRHVQNLGRIRVVVH